MVVEDNTIQIYGPACDGRSTIASYWDSAREAERVLQSFAVQPSLLR